MKHLFAGAFALMATMATADPVSGIWQTEPGDTGAYLHVQIEPCGPHICGTIVKFFAGEGSDSSAQDPTGKRIIWDMTSDGNGRYSRGFIWAPDTDKTYRSKMRLKGSSLKVSGCVGPICRGQSWVRIN